jgi:hypothetical protein
MRRPSPPSTPTLSVVLAILLVASTLSSLCIAKAEETGDVSELIGLLRVPTGSRAEARRVERELDRAGLGLHFDRGRVLHHMEVAIAIPTLTLHSKDPDGVFRATIPEWTIVRNLTRTEPEAHHHRRRRHHHQRSNDNENITGKRGYGGAHQYLPIDRNKYHTAEEVEHTLRALTHQYPDRAELRLIGRSARGANIWNLQVGTQYHHGNTTLAVLIMGSLHGTDAVGTEMCLWLAEYLCKEYDASAELRWLMDTMNIQIIPIPNPDSFMINLRYTTKGIDLDRAFPDRISHRYDPDFVEKEVLALIDWVEHYRPVAGATILGGGGAPGGAGMVVRYPWNAQKHPSGFGGVDPHAPARAPDDRALRYLGRAYVAAHPTLFDSDPRPVGHERGLVNGAEWYHRYGSFQDWFHNALGAPHLDLVVSPYLRPSPESLHHYWEDNRAALVKFLDTAITYGVRGSVVNRATGEGVWDAKILIRDINDRSRHLHDVRPIADKRFGTVGTFAKFLVPGRYSVRAEAPGYLTTDEELFRIDAHHTVHSLVLEMVKP